MSRRERKYKNLLKKKYISMHAKNNKNDINNSYNLNLIAFNISCNA
jgi:hypothetical protein